MRNGCRDPERHRLVYPRAALARLCVTMVAIAAGCGGDGGDQRATPTSTVGVADTATATIAATTTPTSTRTAVPETPTVTPTPIPEPTDTPTRTPTEPPASEAGPLAMRRLTAAQYRASLADVLGEDIVVAGRIEPDDRRSGLLAVGSSFVSVTPSGFEQYEAIARSVAEQALDAESRTALVPCEPQADTAPDDACAEQFIRGVGRRLLRRSLTDDDVDLRLAVARESASALGDFHAGLETALATLLLSPEFLFRVEVAEPDPDHPGRQRLDSVSMAARLSYLLWNTTPDEELLDVAERDELVDDDGLSRQVERMLDSPRLENAVRAFFSDLYGFEQIEQGLVRKDPMLFPAFSQRLIDDAREQTLRIVTEHLLGLDGDYRDLFTTRSSFMTRTLGLVYRVPVPNAVGWEPFEFPAGGERAGVLTNLSLLALYSHPGRSSPTLRGKFIREVLLCQDVPPPPGDIDFSMFNEPGGDRRTARERLAVHVTSPVCAGCHSLMDPIGLALENMDGIGAYRETENGVEIDPSGELNGRSFDDAIGLGEALSRDPSLGPCFVQSLYKYAMGRDVVRGEEAFLAEIEGRLEESGYRMRDLLRMIVTSEAFRTTSGPLDAEEPSATPTSGDVPSRTPTAVPTGPTASPTVGDPAASPTPRPTATPQGVTFRQLQDEIFTPRCATQFCHSRQTKAGSLVLEGDEAFANLVGAASTNAAAKAAGMPRVDPFAPKNSFLILKLSGPPGSAYGARMPLVGSPLSEEEIDLIRGWILAGATGDDQGTE
jgi:hypothetical protein